MNFTNKVIWITGASSGIGKELAIYLSKLDAKLIISARNEEKLEAVKQACENSETIKILPLDLEDYSNFNIKVSEAISWFGRIDVLVNNGGISQRSLARETSIDVDKRIMNINYLGTIALTKAVLPHFIKNNNGQFVVTATLFL